MGFIFIYVTVSSQEEGKKIALHLLKQRLIACANMFPIRSIYFWEGELEEKKELVLLLKTRAELFDIVKKEVEQIHSYTIPCITKMIIEPNQKYGQWLDEQIKLR